MEAFISYIKTMPSTDAIIFLAGAVAVIILKALIWMVFLHQLVSFVQAQIDQAYIKINKWTDDILVLVFSNLNMNRLKMPCKYRPAIR